MPDSAEADAGRIQAIAPDLVVHTAVFNGDGLVNYVAIVNDRLVLRFAKNEYSPPRRQASCRCCAPSTRNLTNLVRVLVML